MSGKRARFEVRRVIGQALSELQIERHVPKFKFPAWLEISKFAQRLPQAEANFEIATLGGYVF